MDCYAVLEVSPDASTAAIRAAYRRLAQEWHPDKNTVPRTEATRRMSEINLAWEILKNPETRRLNDEARNSRSEGMPVRVDADGNLEGSSFDGRAPKMVWVNSGCVLSIGHDGANRLYVEFRTGGLYMYYGVPYTSYGALLHAKSKGRWVIYNVVNGPYLGKRIGA